MKDGKRNVLAKRGVSENSLLGNIIVSEQLFDICLPFAGEKLNESNAHPKYYSVQDWILIGIRVKVRSQFKEVMRSWWVWEKVRK